MEIAVRRSEPGPELPVTAVADEKALLARAARGDGEAFAELYREHVGRVFGLCLRLTADRALAEEHTQESFVRAWENLGKFRAEAAFGTWLYRIAANLALGGLRDRNRRGLKVVQGLDSALVEAVPEHASPVSGDVRIEGVDAELELESVSGDAMLQRSKVSRLSMQSTSGDVTFSGDIDNSFGPKPRRTDKYAPGVELRFTEGKGSARVRINTLSGEARLDAR